MALRDVFGLPDGGIRRALTAFPGLGLRGETCGAVTASMVGIGLVYGRDDVTDASGLPRAVMPVVQLCETVKSVAGSTQCGDILEAATGRRYDFLDKEDAAAYFASPEALRTCFLVVQTATHTAADLLIQAAA